MTAAEVVSQIVMPALTVVALLVIAYQTFLTRNSLDTSRRSLDHSRKLHQVGMIPRMYVIIEVQYHLSRWVQDLADIASHLQTALDRQDDQSLAALTNRGVVSPKGLVSQSLYDCAPTWLAEFYMAGARHYYNAACLMQHLLTAQQEPDFALATAALDRCRDTCASIEELLSYLSLDEILPSVLLDTPASGNDRDYF